MRTNLAPDLEQARKFLKALDPTADKFVFQTFDDGDGKKRPLARVIPGVLDQLAEQLTALNQQGAGVFVTVNRSKNSGRKKEDISAYRAIWREADAPDLPALPIKPHMVIETSPGHKHEYLLIEDTDPDQGDATMQAMVDQWGSDPSAKDRSRVLRLPGFYHRKSAPRMVRIVETNNRPRYSLAEVARHIPPIRKECLASSPKHADNSQYGAKAIAEELATVYAASEGQRNDVLNRAAFSLGQLVGGGVMDRRQVENALTAAATNSGLGACEVAATIRSGVEAGMKEPRATPDRQQSSKPQQHVKPANCVDMICAANIKPEAVNWLWHGWLAAGKIHILAGIAGHGKSTLLFGMGATISNGGRWPDGTRAEVGDVVIWSGEDDPSDTIVPRLIAAGADLSRVHIIRGVTVDGEKRSFDPSTDIPTLRQAMTGKQIKLLIVDPIVSAVAGDSHKNAEVRRSLQPLVDLAAELDVAVYGVTHFTKGTAGRDPIERVTSSLAFGALTRLVTVAIKLADEGNHPKGARLFARAKSNIGPDGGGFHYFIEFGPIPGHPDIENTHITWGGQVGGTARELLSRAESAPDDQGATGEATAWIQEALADGPVAASKIIKEGKKLGFSPSTLRRAKDRLGIESSKLGFSRGWRWSLPEETTKVLIQPGTDSSSQNSTQHIDFYEETTKEPTRGFFGGDDAFEHARRHQRVDSSDGPNNGGGLGAVDHPKKPLPSVWTPSGGDGFFNGDDEVVL